jgi:hypothetical protein
MVATDYVMVFVGIQVYVVVPAVVVYIYPL